MKITIVSLTALLWLSCKAQVNDDGGTVTNAILKLQATVDLLFEHIKASSTLQEAQSSKMIAMEEHLKALSALHEEPLQALSASQEEHNQLLPSLQKCSRFLDLVNQNECSDGSHGCSEFANCIDTAFSYKCRCLDGYSGDGFQCQEINYCQTNPCHPKAECQNFIGHYNCTCQKPYEGDGHNCEFSCQSIGATEVGILGCLTLVRTQVTFEDSRKECQSRGMRLVEGISNREQFRDIRKALEYDYYMWVGGQGRRWITSTEDIHQSLYWGENPNGDLDECIALFVRYIASVNEGVNDVPCTYTYFSLCQYVISD